MGTILPTKYVFNNHNVLTSDKTHVGILAKTRKRKPEIGVPAVLSFCFILFPIVVIAIEHLEGITHYLSRETIILNLEFLAIPLLTGIFLLVVILIDLSRPFNRLTANRPYDSDCQFALLPKSNLIVLQDQNNYPEHENETKSYPYQLYVKDPTKNNNLAYLGQIKNNQIRLNNDTKTSNLFANYYDYAQKHHLANKFEDKLYFIKDPDTTDINGISQFVLQGDGIILKMKSYKEPPYQIYTEKG